MKRTRTILIASLATVAVAVTAIALVFTLFPGSADATHSWGGYHWARTSNPFTIKLGNNLQTGTSNGYDWNTHLTQTSSDWTKSTVMDTTIVAGGSTARRCRATAGRVEVCNYTYGNNGWLGLASISITGGTHITQGTVKVNDTYFNTPTYDNTAEREHVMCQEVGHTFGLDHQDTSGASLNTCMDYYHNTSNSDTKSTTPNQHDYDELGIIYAHLDSTTTIGAAPASAPAEIDSDSPAEWGKLVHGAANGHAATYVRDFGHGNAVVTFVIFAN